MNEKELREGIDKALNILLKGVHEYHAYKNENGELEYGYRLFGEDREKLANQILLIETPEKTLHFNARDESGY